MKKRLACVLFFCLAFSAFTQACFHVPFDGSYSRKPIQLENIKYQFNKKDIDPSAYACLDSLVVFLQKNDSLAIQIRVHNDSRSAADAEKTGTRLTHARAKSIRDYLVSKGINEQRIIPVGMSDTEPLITDEEISAMKSKEEVEKAHQQNRRTDFVIISGNFRKH